jgi:hypothetical protein
LKDLGATLEYDPTTTTEAEAEADARQGHAEAMADLRARQAPSQLALAQTRDTRPLTERPLAERPYPARWTTPRTGGQIANLISTTAKEVGLPKSVLAAVIKQESGFNPSAKSPAGAMGLMQLMPGTAQQLGVTDPYNPQQNIRAGATYLKQQLAKFGSLPLALAAYNAGPGAVSKYGKIPPYKETRQYVAKIMNDLSGQRAPSAAGTVLDRYAGTMTFGADSPLAAAGEWLAQRTTGNPVDWETAKEMIALRNATTRGEHPIASVAGDVLGFMDPRGGFQQIYKLLGGGSKVALKGAPFVTKMARLASVPATEGGAMLGYNLLEPGSTMTPGEAAAYGAGFGSAGRAVPATLGATGRAAKEVGRKIWNNDFSRYVIEDSVLARLLGYSRFKAKQAKAAYPAVVDKAKSTLGMTDAAVAGEKAQNIITQTKGAYDEVLGSITKPIMQQFGNKPISAERFRKAIIGRLPARVFDQKGNIVDSVVAEITAAKNPNAAANKTLLYYLERVTKNPTLKVMDELRRELGNVGRFAKGGQLTPQEAVAQQLYGAAADAVNDGATAVARQQGVAGGKGAREAWQAVKQLKPAKAKYHQQRKVIDRLLAYTRGQGPKTDPETLLKAAGRLAPSSYIRETMKTTPEMVPALKQMVTYRLLAKATSSPAALAREMNELNRATLKQLYGNDYAIFEKLEKALVVSPNKTMAQIGKMLKGIAKSTGTATRTTGRMIAPMTSVGRRQSEANAERRR